ncbi:MAG: hypothetical protein VX672_08325 [Planctomycetota bacterium]|nr:hypothetical protein [Planctomycetota bacterium]
MPPENSAKVKSLEVRLVRHAALGGLPSVALISFSPSGKITMDTTGHGRVDDNPHDGGFETEG